MNEFVLAIETSIKNGSLALLAKSEEIDGWIGNNETSRSEDLLLEIKNLLERNNLVLSQIEKIAVSVGPGSFTGLRVGIATAKALAFSTGCQLAGVPILQAIAVDYFQNKKKVSNKISVVLSAGRGLFFWQTFSRNEMNQSVGLKTGDASILESELSNENISPVLFEAGAFEDYRRFNLNIDKTFDVHKIEVNYACLIGKQANRTESDNLKTEPLYIRPAVAIRNET